jgi:hypothetical protein
MSRALASAVSVSVMAEEVTHLDVAPTQVEFYCPRCHAAIADPLVCGDCSAIICRKCGTPLEKIDELGIG